MSNPKKGWSCPPMRIVRHQHTDKPHWTKPKEGPKAIKMSTKLKSSVPDTVNQKGTPSKYLRDGWFIDGIKPSTTKQWVTLADEMVKWAELPTSRAFNQFALDHKYSPSRFRNWNENDYFVECVERARTIIWNRMLGMAMAEDPVQVIMKTMHLNNPEEQAWQERKLTIDKKSDGPQVVIIEKYPETDIVPTRKKA